MNKMVGTLYQYSIYFLLVNHVALHHYILNDFHSHHLHPMFLVAWYWKILTVQNRSDGWCCTVCLYFCPAYLLRRNNSLNGLLVLSKSSEQ